jgi:threonine aldolase
VFGSVQPQPLDHAPDGTLPLAQIEAAIKPDDAHFARTKLLALENTLGGKLLPFDYVQAATDLAKRKGLQRHLDGARLFNAATAQAAQNGRTDVRAEARRIAHCFDSVSVCFSKGLGAPIGSALVGSREFIARAHRIRKMAGGGMRQAGLLAAAASHALDHHVDRLADDHALAQRLAQGLEGIEGLKVEAPHTNIVFVDLTGAAQARSSDLIASLNRQGILATGLYRLRFVTHLDVDAAGVDRAVGAIRAFFNA